MNRYANLAYKLLCIPYYYYFTIIQYWYRTVIPGNSMFLLFSKYLYRNLRKNLEYTRVANNHMYCKTVPVPARIAFEGRIVPYDTVPNSKHT